MKYNQPHGISDPEAAYINGNPSTGTMGSIPPASSIEYDQREIVAVIKYAADKALRDYNNALCQQPTNADLTQLLKAIFGMSNQRKLQSSMNIYINNTTGSDTTGDGTIGAPYKTYQFAVDNAQSRFDLNLEHTITFHGTGNFTNSAVTKHIVYMNGLFAGQSGPQSIVFNNTNATFAATQGHCFYINSGAQVTITGGSYSATWDGIKTSQGCAIAVGDMAVVIHSGGTFNACDIAHLFVYGTFLVVGAYTVAGGSKNHIFCEPGGKVACSSGPYNITVSGTPNFTSSFVNCYGGSVAYTVGTFVGAATGKRYNITGFGTINTAAGGANFFPGNAVGTIAASTGNGEYI